MSTLEFRDVRVDVGHGRHTMTAVDRVTLTVPQGRIVGLVGESGSGKSTLARGAVGLARVTGGSVLLDGVDVTNARGARARDRRRVQMVFQDPRGSLDPRMTVGESIHEALRRHSRPTRREAREETATWLELVGLDPGCARLLPRALSGGQRQRVALARALAAKPDVIIADEITSALDVSVQGALLNLVRDLQRRLGLGMLFISHNLAVVRYISDEVAVMHRGRIVESGTTEEIIDSPLHPYTRGLLRSVPRLGGSLEDAADIEDIEDADIEDAADPATADPRAAVTGCRFRSRCPQGPAVRPDHRLCAEADPQEQAALRPHRAACHYIDGPAGPTVSGGQMNIEQLQAKLDDAVARLNVPGAALGVWHQGREQHVCSGVTSVENPLPIDEHTLFQVGSMGKTFTATAIMRLVEQGRIDLDAPVRTYLPDLKLQDEDTAERVTVVQLLNHTAGWEGDRMDDTGEGDDALARYVDLMSGFEQLTPLGSVVSYNNGGFALAGRLIERITGTTYEDAIKELVLDPLGLDSSFFFQNEIMTRRFVAGHHQHPDDEVTVVRPWKLPRSANAAGGLCSTTRDIIAWARFHLGDGRSPSGEHVLSGENLALMRHPTVDTNGSALGDQVAISWLLRDVDGVRLVGHGGTSMGQHSQLTMVPERDFAVVVLTNCGPSGAQLNDELVRWALQTYADVDDQEPEPVAADEATLARYSGEYETPVTVCTVTVEDGQLVLRMKMKEEELARLREMGETPPQEPPPATLGLLPGSAHRYVVTSGPGRGMKGYFASEASGEIVGLNAGGRMATRVTDR